METQTKERIIKFCKTALITKQREDKTEYAVFNKDTEFKPYWEEIESILYKRNFEIQDFYYRMLDNALSDIGYYLENNEDLNDFEENMFDYCEADIYNHELIKWLSEGNSDYVDDILQEIDLKNDKTSFMEILQYAQQRHKEEIYFIALEVVKYLKNEFENEEELKGVEE